MPSELEQACPTCPAGAGERCRYWIPQEGGWGPYRQKPHARRLAPDAPEGDDDDE